MIRSSHDCKWKVSEAPKKEQVTEDLILELVLPERTIPIFCDTVEDLNN